VRFIENFFQTPFRKGNASRMNAGLFLYGVSKPFQERQSSFCLKAIFLQGDASRISKPFRGHMGNFHTIS
jgi:hypothetical protein